MLLDCFGGNIVLNIFQKILEQNSLNFKNIFCGEVYIKDFKIFLIFKIFEVYL